MESEKKGILSHDCVVFVSVYNDGSSGNHHKSHKFGYITMVQTGTVVKNCENGKKYKNVISSFITTIIFEPSVYGIIDSIFLY